MASKYNQAVQATKQKFCNGSTPKVNSQTVDPKVYIPATSVCTAEINDLNGITGDWTGLCGNPL